MVANLNQKALELQHLCRQPAAKRIIVRIQLPCKFYTGVVENVFIDDSVLTWMFSDNGHTTVNSFDLTSTSSEDLDGIDIVALVDSDHSPVFLHDFEGESDVYGEIVRETTKQAYSDALCDAGVYYEIQRAVYSFAPRRSCERFHHICR